ncbi:hypothetical protein AB0C34_16990 [Nocardia sp. NPDC049220]|uniref:hypothetical protein n=1 Tax=Nocardia sp. NPDC049220 TaxID=3155273 RepID=UPI003407E730
MTATNDHVTAPVYLAGMAPLIAEEIDRCATAVGQYRCDAAADPDNERLLWAADRMNGRFRGLIAVARKMPPSEMRCALDVYGFASILD